MSEFVNVKVKTFFPSVKSMEDIDIRPGLYRACQVVEKAMYETAPYSERNPDPNGHLRDKIHIELPNDHTGFIGVDETGMEQPYAVYQEYGTGNKAEGPGGSQAKRIPWIYKDPYDGKTHLSFGNKATHFMENALSYNEAEVERIIAEAVKEEIIKLMNGGK